VLWPDLVPEGQQGRDSKAGIAKLLQKPDRAGTYRTDGKSVKFKMLKSMNWSDKQNEFLVN
jgi:hypothetical protein